MTPRQKAIILHDKMFVNSKSIGGAFTDWELAKQCAFMLVDEIINVIEFMAESNELDKLPFWQQVKNEIEKL